MPAYDSVIHIDPTEGGATPTIGVSGEDIDIGLDLVPQGDGQVTIDNNPITTVLDNASGTISSIAPGPSVLFLYTLPGNTFIRAGDSMWIRAAGKAASTSNFKRLQFTLGGTILFDTDNTIQNGAGHTPGGGWFLDAWIMKETGDVIKSIVTFSAGFTTVTWNTKPAYLELSASSAVDIEFAVMAATTIADGDITGEMFMATFLPGKV
jgi:hypothetical protein